MGCLASKQSGAAEHKPPTFRPLRLAETKTNDDDSAASTAPTTPVPEPEVGGGALSSPGHYAIVQEGEAGMPLGTPESAVHSPSSPTVASPPTSPAVQDGLRSESDITDPDWKPDSRDRRGKSGSVFAFASRNAKVRLSSDGDSEADDDADRTPDGIEEEDEEGEDEADGLAAMPQGQGQGQGQSRRRKSSLIEQIDMSMRQEGMDAINEDDGDEEDGDGDGEIEKVQLRQKKVLGAGALGGDPRFRMSIAIANELRGKIGLGGAKPRKKKTVVPPTMATIPASPAPGNDTAAPKQSNLSRQKLRQTAVPEPQYDIAQNYKMHPENLTAFMNDSDTPQPRGPLATLPLVDDEVVLDDTQLRPHDKTRDSHASVALLATDELDALESRWKEEGLAEVVDQLDHRVSIKNPQTKKYSSLQQDEVDRLMQTWEEEGKKEAAIIEASEAAASPQSGAAPGTMATSSLDVDLE